MPKPLLRVQFTITLWENDNLQPAGMPKSVTHLIRYSVLTQHYLPSRGVTFTNHPPYRPADARFI